MDSAFGTVQSVDDGRVTVAIDSAVACPRCAEGRGCGAGLFQSRQRRRLVDVELPAGIHVAAGDEVAVTIGPRSLLKAALYAYGLPLGGMLATLAVAGLLWPALADLGYVAAAAAGLAGGFLLGRKRLRMASLCRELRPNLQRF